MIQLALIGVGAWGKNYISTLKLFTDCRLKYLCANSQKSLQAFTGDYIKTTNYKKLSSYQDIDGIIIATPNSTHYKIACEFLKKGINLLIEKPLVEDYLQTRNLKYLQQKKGAKILVGHTYLFDPAYIKTKELVKDIGHIRYIAYEGTNNGPYRKNTSTLWDVGPHAVSICLDIYQKEPMEISAWAIDSLRPNNRLYDFSFIKIKFQDRTEAFIKISWLFPLKKRELVIVGSKHSIIYDAVADKRVIYYKDMIPNKTNIGFCENDTKISFPKYSSRTPLELEIREFVNAIKNNNKIFYSGLDFSVKITKVIKLAEKSILQHGKPMKVSQ